MQLQIASFRGQMLSSLMGASDASAGSFADALGLATQAGDVSGRNLSLRDPESAYQMMSDINGREVNYKAQFSELSQMREVVSSLAQAGDGLTHLDGQMPAAELKAQLEAFAGQYNAWIARFEPDVDKGGMLDGVQAAEISIYELEQSVKNLFFGADHGVSGLGDLGIGIDPQTHTMSIDATRLDAALAGNRDGVFAALNDFGGNFAKSANLLASENNFIDRRLDNLDGAIDYIGDNISSWRKEFGTGDSAMPGGQVARALAAYAQMSPA